MRKRNLAAAAATITVCAFATGCGEDGPFSLTVTKVNESGPQRNAVIAISDPQIYTRERLLNDRDLEYAYLKKQLDEIDTKDFTPRLKRDLDEFVEVAAALQAKVNPIAGAEVAQAAQVTELSNDVQIERLKNLLNDVKDQQAAADASSVGNTPAATDTSALGSTGDLDSVIKTTQQMLSNLQDQIAKQNANRPPLRDNTVKSATPMEELRDKLAYRNEIQSALEQAQLDDRHDLNGNALYRLQFKATIFPGQVKDKYGVARLTVLPPVFDDKRDVSKLYLDWLAFVAAQLNAAATEQKDAPPTHEQEISERYRLLGEATGVYQVLPISYAESATVTDSEVPSGSGSEPNLGTLTFAFPSLTVVVHDNPPSDKTDAKLCAAAFTKTSATQEGTVPAAATPQAREDAGKFFAPLPPGVPQDQVLAALHFQCSKQLVKYFQVQTSQIEAFARNQEVDTSFLRWAPTDKGRCWKLQRPTSLTDKAPVDVFDLSTDKFRPSEVSRRLKDSLSEDMAEPSYDPTLIVKDGEALGTALIVAQNIHNLTPAYVLGIQRTVDVLRRSGSSQAKSITALQDYASRMSSAAAAADQFLSTFHDSILAPIALQLSDAHHSSSPLPEPSDDIYTALVGNESASDVRKTLKQIEKSQSAQFDRSQLLNDIEDQVPCISLVDIAGRITIPDAFYDTITGSRGKNYPIDEHKPYAGSTYAYSTAPQELAQRISTVASATQALDLMAAVSALIPQAGTSLAASSELRQIATGHVDAIESAPLIVGFSNSGAANVETDQFGAQANLPSFGWVFGPKVTLDSEESKLRLSQVLVEQPVTADISVPGWWRMLRLRVETAWAANFDKAMLAGPALNGSSEATRQPKNRVSDYIVEVPLQTNPGTYEQLSEYIANKTWGLQYKRPVIIGVEPAAIPACTDMKLLVTGPDLWRGRQVYLNGIAASKVQIMPDMQGLEATFDLSKSKPGAAELTVWTQLGQAHFDQVKIAKADTCAPKQDDAGVKTTVKGPKVVIPEQSLIVSVDKDVLPGDNYFLAIRLGAKPDSPVYPDGTVNAKTNQFTLTMPKETVFRDQLKLGKAGELPDDGSQMSIELHKDDKADPKTLATVTPLYFYKDPIDKLLQGKVTVAALQGAGNYSVSFPVPPHFADAYGDSATVNIVGFMLGADKQPIEKLKIFLTDSGKTGNVSFQTKDGSNKPDKVTFVLKFGDADLSTVKDVPVKKANGAN